MEKQIAVVICNYNGGEYLTRCVESILSSNRDDFDIIIVDNASTDTSAEDVVKRFSEIVLLRNKENLGGAGGFQTGFSYALNTGYPYIMAMDNDAFIASNTMSQLYDYLREHPETGMAAAKIMCMEEPDKVLDYNGKLDYKNLTVRMDWWLKSDSREAEVVAEPDFAPTTTSMLTKEALEASGGMDPEYFIYLDDIEMSCRIKLRGYKIVTLGYAKAWHKSGLSQSGTATTFKQYYFNRNRYYFFSKFAPEEDVQYVAENILKDTFNSMMQALRDGYPAVFDTARWALEDYIDNIRGKAGFERIRKVRHVPSAAIAIDVNNSQNYTFFKNLYYDRVIGRIAALKSDMREKSGEEMAKVSVIIPVYNTEKYLSECIDSVLEQSLEEIEVICVDDGSTDASGKILDEYAIADNRIVVIHKKNEGYGKAINTGIEHATAEYLGIVESDDFIEKDMYQVLYDTMNEKHVDVIKADYYSVYERDGCVIKKYVPLNIYGGGELYRKILCPKDTPEVMLYVKYTWSGLYRTDFIKNEKICHNETPGAAYQDNGFWFQTMVNANRIYFLDEAFYNYRQDNPEASFYNKGNPMAELDEFRFAEEKLIAMGEKGNIFYSWLSLFLLSNGYYSFHRVSKEYKEDVALRIRDEFYRLSEEGRIDYELFSDAMRKELFFIIANPHRAAERDSSIFDGFLGHFLPYQKYYVYGAGKRAKRLLDNMRGERLHQKLDCFIVSSMQNNPERIEEIPVRTLDKCSFETDSLVIIAVKNSEGIEDKLKHAGANNITNYEVLNIS